jgi:hypothetical protein
MNYIAVRLLTLLLLTLVVGQVTARGESGAKSAEFRGKLSSLPSLAEELGAGWHGPTGLVIDDVDDLSTLDAQAKQVAATVVKQLKPLKVKSVADFTYTRRDTPQIVTVRIFVFESRAAARDWWRTKYKHPGWEQYYQETRGLGDESVKSTELAKEMSIKGNVWLTSHQLHKGQEYREALAFYLENIFPAAKPASRK